MAIANKKEIEVFYKTHNLGLKDVAEHFGVNYRTLAHWAKTESWEQGSAIKDIKELREKVVQKGLSTQLTIAKNNIKDEIKQNLGSSLNELDSIIANNLLEASTESLLLQTMTAEHITKNQALACTLAKESLIKIKKDSSGSAKDEANVIVAAEKVAKMYSDLKESIYGKNVRIIDESANNEVDFDNMSAQELDIYIAKLQKENEKQALAQGDEQA